MEDFYAAETEELERVRRRDHTKGLGLERVSFVQMFQMQKQTEGLDLEWILEVR